MKPDQIEIVLVEDNIGDAKLTIMALRKANVGNHVELLRDGEQALDYIFFTGKYADRKADYAIGLILLDLKMPRIDGIEVLKKIKSDERSKHIPVAVFTSSQEDPDIKECYRLGANSYIVKPLDFEQFANTVKEAGLYWLMINHPPL